MTRRTLFSDLIGGGAFASSALAQNQTDVFVRAYEAPGSVDIEIHDKNRSFGAWWLEVQTHHENKPLTFTEVVKSTGEITRTQVSLPHEVKAGSVLVRGMKVQDGFFYSPIYGGPR